MRNNVLLLLLSLLLIPFVLPAQTTATAPGGSGTIGDPYIISTLGELSYVAQNLGATNYWASGVYFLQTAAINAAGTQYWDDADDNSDGDKYNDPNDGTATGNNEGFKPIGNLSVRYYGNYDGGGFAVSNLYINRTYAGSGGELGFFGFAQGGTIQNLSITDATLTYKIDYFYGSAAAIGGSYLSAINNVHVVGGTMTISATSSHLYAGGVLGRGEQNTLTSCSSTMDITSNYNGGMNMGGLIGHINASSGSYSVTECFATGAVSGAGGTRIGGFAGELSGGGTISRCYSTGAVTNTNGGYRGGFVGNAYQITIQDCYTLSPITVTNSASVGGFFSSSPTASFNKPTFINCYTASTITGGVAGGFGGQSNFTNTYTNSFWDTQTTGTSTGVPSGLAGALTGKTTVEMQTQSTFTDAGWDWVYEAANGTNDYWAINPGYNSDYPFLEWSGFPLPFAPHGGYSLDFDGTDDYVEIAHDAALNPANITVEAWFNPRDIAGQSIPPIVKKVGAAEGYAIEINNASSELRFHVQTAGDWYTSPAYVVPSLNQWYHVAGTYDGNDIQLYVNGVLIGATPIVGSLTHSTNPLAIGYDMVNAGRYWDGQIDEVRIWSDIRSQAEIQANMHKELTGNEANLEAYYAMHDGSGTSLTDNSPNDFTGTLTNGPTWKTSGAHAGPGMALDFDGADDYVSVPDDNALDLTNTFTIEGWVNPDAFAGGTYGRIISKSNAYGLGFSNSVIRFTTYNVQDYDQSYSLPTGTWTHVAITMDGGNDVTFYVNGNNVGTIPGASPASTNTEPLLIGGSTYSAIEDFDGKIDEVRIWSAVRTEAQIRASMCRTLDGDEANLVAYYRLDQQADAGHTTAYDLTGNGHNGTLTNMDAATDWVASTPFNTWIGSEDSDWSNADNWSRGAVPATEDVGVFVWSGSNLPASANISGRNLYVDVGASLSHSGNLTLSGDYYNAGTFTTTGNVTFSGSAAQAIQGTGASTFGTLTVNNAAGVTMAKGLTTTTSLTLTNGALSIGANTLTINGAISQASGSLSGDASSSIVIGGSGASTGLPSVNLGNLTLNRTNGITLAGTVTVNGALTLSSGVLDLATRSLVLGSAASIGGTPGAASHIDATSGSFRKDYSGTGSFAFPVGDGTAYSPITLNFTAGAFSTGYATVGLTAAKHPSNSSATHFINRYWTVSSSGISGFTCQVSAQYDNGDINGTEGNLHGGKWNGSAWTDLGAVNTGSNLISGTVTGFSDFTAGEAVAFPVEWLSFEAKQQGGLVRLDWSTASELNSDYFAVERSADQQNWNTLGQVSAAGYSSAVQNYRYDDAQPLNGKTYYRLRQVDLDGTFDYSNVVEISLQAGAASIYPNPVNDKLTIDIPGQTPIMATLIDMQGRKVMQQALQPGQSSLLLGDLPSGIYLLRLSDEQGWTQEMQVVKE